ncbi:phosphopantetheine-binding protein [Phaeobacter sp. HF9A]|uniref:phosphopantetheine-binding protein n=1 Tax=Phaeobacter sp. HF9A TaxID=2721561 RepID=UPI00142FEBAB|nr:phosphopantetheine-binding protein [Phaeobacter sp. HF9A]NIZ12600.1 phosphopantetheine-binding protein [Phaeobacter sp. HF9A]
MTQTYESHVIAAVAELLDMDSSDTITSASRIEDDLGIDSGLLLELFMMLEERLPGLEIDPSALRPEQFATIGSFAAMLSEDRSEKVPA